MATSTGEIVEKNDEEEDEEEDDEENLEPLSAEDPDSLVCRFCSAPMVFVEMRNFSNATIETKFKCSKCKIEHSTFQGGSG